ncbi:MAG TPA: alkaline phosphatase family protein, partial [Gemmatimonadaceae bacterium]|nr:alkaline phosphatase family protein [Gemmatimonadaceae bacterium]
MTTPDPRPAHRLTDHVILVSVDSLRPEFYQQESWPMPVVQQLARDGSSARQVLSVFPALTYPAHTSIVTGALP